MATNLSTWVPDFSLQYVIFLIVQACYFRAITFKKHSTEAMLIKKTFNYILGPSLKLRESTTSNHTKINTKDRGSMLCTKIIKIINNLKASKD